MRYPVTVNGTKQEFQEKWYIPEGGGFGSNRNTYLHEGLDINLRTGGDTDLGQELKAIANGKVTYYHYSSHPSTAFGRHLVYKIDGSWGSRWVHYAHCQDTGFTGTAKNVNEGEIIARIGKSGTTYAHLHISIFKVDPASIGGIDTIARNQEQLNAWWEDPIKFIDTWSQPTPPAQPVITDSTIIPQINGWEVQRIRSELIAKDARIADLAGRMERARSELQL